jgi:integrase
MGVRVRFWKGAWWVFVNHQGRRKAKRVGDRDTAVRVAQALRERLARGEFALPTHSAEHNLRTYATAWLETMRGSLKASTLRFCEGNLRLHLFPALGTRPVSSLSRQDCRAIVAACRAKGLRRETIRGVVRTLSTVLTQAVEDELLPANPALRLGRYLRAGDEAEPAIDALSRNEAADLLETARVHFPDWYAWLLCGLRTGLRLGELLALQWGDIDWRGRFVHIERNLVDGTLTTPKNHQQRRVDLSMQLRAVLRLWRRQQRAAWLAVGRPLPPWVFPSVAGTALDGSNARKVLNQLLDKAELHRRGPHQMRHTFASLLLQAGAPITYVSRQLGHKDPSITLRVYAHWLPEATSERGVDRLDETQPSATPAQPAARAVGDERRLSHWGIMVSRDGIEPSTRRLRVCCSAN